jgi:hypothetical protein
MASVAHDEKLIFMFFDEFLSFNISLILMSLHSQKNHVVGLTSLMFCYFFNSLAQKFFIFFVAGNNKSMKNLVPVWVII